ncbi:MAG: UDP-N-acetylmuramoyl-L-alanine--D-glutamate ligase, partial [Aestuariivirga sp.]
SFQIDLMPSLKPDVGILTNITPDHLDRHGTLENYAAVKARLFAKMDAGATALIGVDDVSSAQIFAKHKCATAVSVQRALNDGLSAPDGILRSMQGGKQVDEIDLSSMPALKGRHNWQNACMAFGAAKALGLSTAKIATAMQSFPGLAHRMQEIARLGKVAFVNDSKATNADATEKALSSFDNIYWIAGGIAKAGGIEPLAPLFNHISKAYLIGAAASDFAHTLKGKVEFELCETLEHAVQSSARDAGISAKLNPVVLLSPACASFDQYQNFEIRGQAFAGFVAKLPGIIMAQGGLS